MNGPSSNESRLIYLATPSTTSSSRLIPCFILWKLHSRLSMTISSVLTPVNMSLASVSLISRRSLVLLPTRFFSIASDSGSVYPTQPYPGSHPTCLAGPSPFNPVVTIQLPPPVLWSSSRFRARSAPLHNVHHTSEHPPVWNTSRSSSLR